MDGLALWLAELAKPRGASLRRDEQGRPSASSKEAAVPLDLAQPSDEKPLCPREGHRLTHRDVVGIEFFFCKTCHGLWFGAGALEELALHVAAGGSVPMSLASCRP